MASSLLKPPSLCRDLAALSGSSRGNPLMRPPTQRLAFALKLSKHLVALAVIRPSEVSMPSESPESLVSSDAAQGEVFSPVSSGPKINLPPRMCTLREFGEGMVAVDSDVKVSSFFQSLAANIEFSVKVQDWEILSGRLAMMVFSSAVLVEAVTGNSVFEKMDTQRLLEVCAAVLASIFVAAGFALALQAKTRVAYTVSKGYENLMNALIDNVIDSLLFDREDT